MGTKILFFGGFGPLENRETGTSEPDEAEFGWFNDLFSFDTGINIIPCRNKSKQHHIPHWAGLNNEL